MKSRIEKLVFQFDNVFNGTPYYGDSIKKIIDQLDPTQANNSINEGHSIAQIIKHMIAWRQYAIEHLKGNEEYDIVLGSDVDWAKTIVSSPSEWNELKEEFEQSHKSLVELLKQKEDNWLSTKMPGKVFSYNIMLKGIIQHDLYHIGQVNLLKSA